MGDPTSWLFSLVLCCVKSPPPPCYILCIQKTYGHSPAYPRSPHCCVLGVRHLPSKYSGSDTRLLSNARGVPPRVARRVPISSRSSQSSVHSSHRDLRLARSHLGKPVRMRRNDRDISRLRLRIVERDILLHGQVEILFLVVGCRGWVFADILAGDQMFHDAKDVTTA